MTRTTLFWGLFEVPITILKSVWLEIQLSRSLRRIRRAPYCTHTVVTPYNFGRSRWSIKAQPPQLRSGNGLNRA
ncbi:hypothetical protein THAOC_09895 [Thalassiosira oceanica]|uniref:Uncharacterized protein n=1 Tax=Thalassiosira oceanica TaxID=159749 RepID=K0STZ7_THAOC|nr:hypothetical protein THAOC_09895 [Thalassiosira oceanica]|eukprot:EJK68890.1 hypothetical protein THAOC_09895 [Thalassiosira oceanica]